MIRLFKARSSFGNDALILRIDGGMVGYVFEGQHRGEFGRGEEIDPRLDLTAPLRHRLEGRVAELTADGSFSKAEADAFLDRLFADPVEVLAATALELRAP